MWSFADGLITNKAIFDMYQHYRKPLNYGPRKFKNSPQIYVFIEIPVHKSRKMVLHR